MAERFVGVYRHAEDAAEEAIQLVGRDAVPGRFEGQVLRKQQVPRRKIPGGDDHFWQGDIGTHGLHLLFQAESDNARLTVPVDEIVSEWRMVFLHGNPGNVGERYGRSFEKPLVATVQ